MRWVRSDHAGLMSVVQVEQLMNSIKEIALNYYACGEHAFYVVEILQCKYSNLFFKIYHILTFQSFT